MQPCQISQGPNTHAELILAFRLIFAEVSSKIRGRWADTEFQLVFLQETIQELIAKKGYFSIPKQRFVCPRRLGI
jgi:hypothetical protein